MTENEAISRIKDHMEIHKLKEPRAIYITVALSMAITALKEVQQYHKIGTVEECREAAGKQKPNRPLGGADIAGNEYMICPNCSAIVEDGEWRADYCPDCGQAIQWDENLEGMEDENT